MISIRNTHLIKSGIPLIWHPSDWTGAALTDILRYHRIPILPWVTTGHILLLLPHMDCTIIKGVFHSDICFSSWFFKILQPLLSKCALVFFLSGDSPVYEFYVLKCQHIKFRCWRMTQKKDSIFRTWWKTDIKNKCALVNYFHCITERLGFLNYQRSSHWFSFRKCIAVNHLVQHLITDPNYFLLAQPSFFMFWPLL